MLLKYIHEVHKYEFIIKQKIYELIYQLKGLENEEYLTTQIITYIGTKLLWD